jgi:transposase
VRRVLGLSDELFTAWHPAREGRLAEGVVRYSILWLIPRVSRDLEAGTKCECMTMARTCAEILRMEKGVWNFVWFPGGEPTNNAAAPALRHAVIWRRISDGTASKSGSRFVERVLTVVATCRQRGRNVLEYLRSCLVSDRKGQAISSLLPTTRPAIKVALFQLPQPVNGYLGSLLWQT